MGNKIINVDRDENAEYIENNITDIASKTFTSSKEPTSIHVSPDLTKFIMIGDAKENKPFYSIYNIITGKQIQHKINPEAPKPRWGHYSFGCFDKDDINKFIFCIGVWSRKIFYINMETGKYTEKLVKGITQRKMTK